MIKKVKEMNVDKFLKPDEYDSLYHRFGYFCDDDFEDAEFGQIVEIINGRFLIRDNLGTKVFYEYYIKEKKWEIKKYLQMNIQNVSLS